MKTLSVAYFNHPIVKFDKETWKYTREPHTYANMVTHQRIVLTSEADIQAYLKEVQIPETDIQDTMKRYKSRYYMHNLRYEALAKYWRKHIAAGHKIIVNEEGGWCTESKGSVEIVEGNIVAKELGII